MSMRWGQRAVSGFVTVGLVAASLGACSPDEKKDDTDAKANESEVVTVAADGATVETGPITVRVPTGAAPEGTEVAVEAADGPAPKSIAGFKAFDTLADGYQISLEGLQPEVPLTVEWKVDSAKFTKGSKQPLVGVLLESEDGAVDVVPGRFHRDGSTVTAHVPHLSSLWPFELDFAGIVDAAFSFVGAVLGFSTPRPQCDEKMATSAGIRFAVTSPDRAWVCVEKSGDILRGQDELLHVSIQANSPVPLIVTSDGPVRDARTQTTDVSNAAAAALGAFAERLRGNQALVFRDANAVFDYQHPPALNLRFRQTPSVQLLATLGAVFDVVAGGLDSRALDVLGRIECLGDVMPAADALRENLPLEAAVGAVQAFFSCVEPLVGNFPGPQRALLALISTAPGLLAGALVGLVNEITGQGGFSAAVTSEVVDIWALETGCRGSYPSPGIDRLCAQRDAAIRATAFDAAYAFIDAWKDSEDARIQAMTTDTVYRNTSVRTIKLARNVPPDCSYDEFNHSGAPMYCYVKGTNGIWYTFGMEATFEHPDPPVWVVQFIGADNY